MKGIDKKDSAIPMESTCNPDRKRNADSEISKVANRDIHILNPPSELF
jgi:hypothetical protein